MDFIKFHRKINPISFIGLRGSETEIKQCTSTLQARPYDLTQASPRTLKSDQQVVCCASVGWARAEIKNRCGNHKFQVQLMDYLDDETGAPMIENISWESIRILPRDLSKIPKLGGIFYLVDENEPCRCGHEIDQKRLTLLLERMSESEELFRCRTLKAMDPLHAVIELHFDLPLNGFLNGKFQIPFIAGNKNPVKAEEWVINEFNIIKEEIIREDDPQERKALLEKLQCLLIGDTGPRLDDLDISDDENPNENMFGGDGFMRPSDFVVETRDSERSFNEISSREISPSPYRKDKTLPPEIVSPSRKMKQSKSKKNRLKPVNNFSGDSSGTGSESTAGDQPSSRSDSSATGGIPLEFLQTEYFYCGDCGLSASTGHKCNRKGNRKLCDMWGRDK